MLAKKRLAKKKFGKKNWGPKKLVLHKNVGPKKLEVKKNQGAEKKIGAEFFFWYETSYQVEIRLHTENNVVYRKSA